MKELSALSQPDRIMVGRPRFYSISMRLRILRLVVGRRSSMHNRVLGIARPDIIMCGGIDSGAQRAGAGS